MTTTPKEKLSLPHFLAGFAANFLISLCLNVAMFIWWIIVFIVCDQLLRRNESRKVRSAAKGAAFCIAFFFISILLWPVFRIIAPKYFDESYDPVAGKVVPPR